MAKDLNQCNFIGRVGKDCEVRYTQSETAVANFSMAVNDVYGSGDNKKESVTWINVVAWGKLGEICGEYVKKGMQLFVSGRLQTRSWEDRDGNKRFQTEIVAQTVQFLGGKGEKKERVEEPIDNEQIPF